ncbi:lytic transglycosylase domain-containing protein [Belnapia moabensis]|uniref:lytic transglycosylase domain-containing protein n=1 Tax=Belnapia moabensis TaxID=365533 RepID=UPI0012ECBE4D|nr:lytic transglycosylase domain-containing protein [Belnapia moabensis]
MSPTLTLAAIHALATACAPSVAPETVAAIARAESGQRILAIRANGAGGGAILPTTRHEAIERAHALLREGRSIDLGLMQINSRNLGWLGLSIEDAFDPCRNIAAGARVLTSFSGYNTGHPQRGFTNGYVARVLAASVSNAAQAPAPAATLPLNPPPPRPPTLSLGRTVSGRTLTYGR